MQNNDAVDIINMKSNRKETLSVVKGVLSLLKDKKRIYDFIIEENKDKVLIGVKLERDINKHEILEFKI